MDPKASLQPTAPHRPVIKWQIHTTSFTATLSNRVHLSFSSTLTRRRVLFWKQSMQTSCRACCRTLRYVTARLHNILRRTYATWSWTYKWLMNTSRTSSQQDTTRTRRSIVDSFPCGWTRGTYSSLPGGGWKGKGEDGPTQLTNTTWGPEHITCTVDTHTHTHTHTHANDLFLQSAYRIEGTISALLYTSMNRCWCAVEQ